MSKPAAAVTPQYRRELLVHIYKSLPISSRKATLDTVIWLHFTDLTMREIDLELLIGEGLLYFDSAHVYQPDGTWQDDFPPSAYRLTQKALDILGDPARWVHTGEWGEKR